MSCVLNIRPLRWAWAWPSSGFWLWLLAGSCGSSLGGLRATAASDQGPAESEAARAAARASHWAFQPIQRVAIPSAWSGRDDAAHPPHPIDAFLALRLRAAGLEAAPEASRATLLRRLSFDLVGLPPTPSELDAFVRDNSPAAYEHAVDRLLASPRYGERWGRHWLDIVRYTESQGFEYDKLRDQAWHYRDYVIQSFNADKPYHRFMMEQVAGDVLEPVSTEGIVGASLLVCGSWDEAGNSQANQTQKAITREEEMEDLVSVVGQTFLGLTVNCARCHAHKFDPIPQEDYYRLKAVFDGVKHGERAIAPPGEVQARETRVTTLKRDIAVMEKDLAAIEEAGRTLAATRQGRGTNASSPPPTPLARWSFKTGDKLALPGELKDGAKIDHGQLRLERAGAYYQSAPLPTDIRQKTLEAWVSLADLQQGGGAAISLETDDGQVFDALVYGERQPRKWVAGSSGFQRTRDLDAPEESARPAEWVHMVAVYQEDGTIALFRNGQPYGQPYRVGQAPQVFAAGHAHVLLGMRHKGGSSPFLTGAVREAALYDRALTPAEVKTAFQTPGAQITTEEMLSHLTPDQRRERSALLERLDRTRAELISLPVLPVSYAGTRVQPAPTRRLKRGDVKSPEETVTPAGLSALTELSPDFGLAADAPEAERRLRFAAWLADPRNPLPARVMANRVWQFHFGQGLVATPSDFGVAGARPTHPELLDWLAGWFIDCGWSVKALHRLIVTSAAYRRSSAFDERAARVDADNQLLWRYSPRRLEAEVLRDAMLAASGQINFQAGGPSVRPFEVQKFPANAYVPIDKPGAEFNRRSVYRMNVNSGKEPLLDAFDCPDPSVKTPRRGVTTTPLQALGLMNNSFVQRQAAQLAARAWRESHQELPAAVHAAYRHALGRSPTVEEVRRATAAAGERSLTNVCWALLNSTEFVYVQ